MRDEQRDNSQLRSRSRLGESPRKLCSSFFHVAGIKFAKQNAIDAATRDIPVVNFDQRDAGGRGRGMGGEQRDLNSGQSAFKK